MEVKNYFATDTQGNVLGSAQVYLYLAGTTTLATGLQNISGAALGNPFTSDANGLVQFKAPDNNYDLRVVRPGREFTVRIQCFDGISFIGYYESDKIASLADYDALKAYSGNATCIRVTNSSLTGFFFPIQSASLPETDGMLMTDAAGRRWLRSYANDIKASWLGVVTGNNSPDVALKNAQSINSGLDFVGTAFPGTVVIGRGTTWLTDTNPGAASWDNNRAIFMRYNGVKLKGQGRGNSILKLIDGANCTVIKVGSYVEQTIAVTRCSISDLQIDASRLTQKTPTDTQDHFSGIAVSNNCQGTILSDLYVTDTPYYGIGLGQDGLDHCKVIRCETNRTGGDGLDWKNNSNTQVGGLIDGFRARNFGLLPLSNVLTPQAGLDMRSGIHATNITIEEMSGESGLIGIRAQTGTAGEISLQPTSFDNFKVSGSGAQNSVGVRIIARGVTSGQGRISGFPDGLSDSNLDTNISDVKSESCAVGFRFWGASESVKASTGTHVGLMARNCTQAGFVVDGVSENDFFGCHSRNNAIGWDVRAGSINNKIIGGSCTGNTSQLNDSGAGTVVRDVSGLRTRQRITSQVLIDPPTGTRNITFTHSLGVTPSKSDVKLTLSRNSNVGDLAETALWVTGTSATQVTAQIRITTASGTSGAVVDVIADIEAKVGS